MKTRSKTTHLKIMAFAVGLVASTMPALADDGSGPFTLLPSASATEASSPLLMSAAVLDAVADAPAGGQAGKPVGADDGWHFRLAVPIWLPGVSGDMTVKGHELTGGNSASDSASKLGDTLDLAAAFHFEAEKGCWGAFVDSMYVSFKDDKDLSTGGTAEATVKGYIGELGGFYTVFAPEPGAKGWGMFRADALAGVRVTWLELGAETNSFDVSASRTLIDPIIPLR